MKTLQKRFYFNYESRSSNVGLPTAISVMSINMIVALTLDRVKWDFFAGNLSLDSIYMTSTTNSLVGSFWLFLCLKRNVVFEVMIYVAFLLFIIQPITNINSKWYASLHNNSLKMNKFTLSHIGYFWRYQNFWWSYYSEICFEAVRSLHEVSRALYGVFRIFDRFIRTFYKIITWKLL